MSVSRIVAGALFDFMGRLTMLEEPITLSGHHEPHQLLEIFKAWADERGLDTNEADVEDWQASLTNTLLLDTTNARMRPMPSSAVGPTVDLDA
jgi:hypothetical protein